MGLNLGNLLHIPNTKEKIKFMEYSLRVRDTGGPTSSSKSTCYTWKWNKYFTVNHKDALKDNYVFGELIYINSIHIRSWNVILSGW